MFTFEIKNNVSIVSLFFILLIIIVLLFFTEIGDKIINKYTEPTKATNRTVFKNSPQYNIEMTVKLSGARTENKFSKYLDHSQKLLEDQTQYYKSLQEEVNKKDRMVFSVQKEEKEESILLNNIKLAIMGIEELKVLYKMKSTAKKVSEKSAKYLLSATTKAPYIKNFSNADLDIIKNNITAEYLEKISEKGKIYVANTAMIKSVSNFIDLEPKEAYEYFLRAQSISPSLPLVSSLTSEYETISNIFPNKPRYAYILIASVKKNKTYLEQTADNIIGFGNARHIRKNKYNLYLDVNQNNIRVYTIIRHINEEDLEEKINLIKPYIKSQLIFRDNIKYPREFILNDSRKDIMIVDSSNRGNEKVFMNKLKSYGFTNIKTKNNWNKKIGFYIIYYDGNSYDKNDLDKILNATREIVNSYVKPFAYQQSKGKIIQKMFTKNLNLKYLIILKKNTLLNP